MQILGINNYRIIQSNTPHPNLPHKGKEFLNFMQTNKNYNIHSMQTNPDCFVDTFSFKGLKVNGFKNIHAFKNIKNSENRAFFEELKKKFKEVPYYKHHDWGYELSPYKIVNLYESCLDANDIVNKYAAQVMFNICHVADEPVKELDIPEWNIKEEASKVFEDWGIEGVTTLINNSKDKNGNHNLNNLKFLLYVDKKVDKGSVPHDISGYVESCKDENGIVTDENARRFKSVNEHPYGEWLIYDSKNLMDTSDTGIKFVGRMLKYMAKVKGERGFLNQEQENIKKIIRTVLEYNKSKEADKIYNILLENSDLIAKDVGQEYIFSSDIPYLVRDSLNSKKEMSSHNLQKLIELKKNGEDELLENIDFLKDKMGYIRNENIEAYKKISEYIFDEEERYGEKQLSTLNTFEGFRTKNNLINKELVNKITEVCEKYNIHSPETFVDNLFHILELFGKKGEINWEVVDILCKYSLKARNTDIRANVINNNNEEVFNFIYDLKNKQIKSKNLELFKKFAGLDNVNEWTNFFTLEHQIQIRETLSNFIKENSSEYKNLYTAEDMLELLRDMNEEGILDCEMMTIPIGEGDIPLLMYLADILPTAENSRKYDKIIRLLKKEIGINYNYKDNMGVSFLEKVMMSENEKLLELIKDKQLEYYPELEYVYKSIQNPEFKEGVKELNIQLPDIEEVKNSKKIQEKAKTIENEKPLLSAILQKVNKQKTATEGTEYEDSIHLTYTLGRKKRKY